MCGCFFMFLQRWQASSTKQRHVGDDLPMPRVAGPWVDADGFAWGRRRITTGLVHAIDRRLSIGERDGACLEDLPVQYDRPPRFSEGQEDVFGPVDHLIWGL